MPCSAARRRCSGKRRASTWDASIAVPNQPVEGLKQNLGSIADFIYGSPSQALWTIGVTGTNGKTSCTQWIAQAFEQFGRSAAVIGTLGSGFVGALEPAPNTTPDAALLHETLARLKAGGAQVVAMEVSSIGLAQDRVNGMKFDVAMFTNLSRDHLDYHGTMAAYGAAKARLFAWPTLLAAVINTDDDFGKGLVDQMRDHAASRLTYGLSGAEITATSIATIAVGHDARRRDAVGPRRAAHVARRHVQCVEPARHARRAARERRSARRCAGRDGRRSRRRPGAWNGTAAASNRSS